MPDTLVCVRRHAKHLRQNLPRHIQRRHGMCASYHLLQHLLCRAKARTPKALQGVRIGLYLPAFGELDIRYAIPLLQAHGAIIFMPVVVGNMLRFVRFLGRTPRRHRLGMHEPLGRTHSADYLNIVVMPLVAINAQGYRMGMGGGFYDRTFAQIACYKIACAHRLAYANFNANSWDIRAHAWVNERGVRAFMRTN